MLALLVREKSRYLPEHFRGDSCRFRIRFSVCLDEGVLHLSYQLERVPPDGLGAGRLDGAHGEACRQASEQDRQGEGRHRIGLEQFAAMEHLAHGLVYDLAHAIFEYEDIGYAGGKVSHDRKSQGRADVKRHLASRSGIFMEVYAAPDLIG